MKMWHAHPHGVSKKLQKVQEVCRVGSEGEVGQDAAGVGCRRLWAQHAVLGSLCGVLRWHQRAQERACW